jgi:hypothetical protein
LQKTKVEIQRIKNMKPEYPKRMIRFRQPIAPSSSVYLRRDQVWARDANDEKGLREEGFLRLVDNTAAGIDKTRCVYDLAVVEDWDSEEAKPGLVN